MSPEIKVQTALNNLTSLDSKEVGILFAMLPPNAVANLIRIASHILSAKLNEYYDANGETSAEI